MRNTELALAALVILGCLFKIEHWPGDSLLLLCGAGGLALFYFPFGFRTLPAPRPTDQVLWMTLLGGLALCTALVGLLAFQLHWPHSQELLVSGAIGCAAALGAGLALRYKRPRLDIYLEALLIRCAVIGLLAITLWSLFTGKPR
jgi:hypothetical protein